MFIPSPTDKKTIQLSNDAFFYLYSMEAPLDEANLEEVEEVNTMFPHGFEITDDWSYIDGDIIQATFIPYIEAKQAFEYDAYWDGSKVWVLQIKYLGNSKVRACIYNPISYNFKELGELDILTNNYGKKYIQLPLNNGAPDYTNVFYLDRFLPNL